MTIETHSDVTDFAEAQHRTLPAFVAHEHGQSSAILGRLLVAGIFAASLLIASRVMAATPGHPYATISDAQGNLHVPPDYRTTYQFLGTWAVAADHGQGSKQMHAVYASPGATAAYGKLGHFPDGTVLIKEVFDTATAGMTTGTVSHATTLKGWFVMVKDGRHSYPQSKLWGDGWGWSWFDAGNPGMTTTKDHNECLGCHQPAHSTDLIYTQGYPILAK